MTVHIRLTKLYTWCDLYITKGLKTTAFEEKGTCIQCLWKRNHAKIPAKFRKGEKKRWQQIRRARKRERR